MTYEIRYCAFVDILGFTELSSALDRGTTTYEHVRDLLRKVHATALKPPADWLQPTNRSSQKRQESSKGSDLKTQSISDALCLSAAATWEGLAHIFYNLEELTLSLLDKGYFVRGAIAKGRLYHDSHMAFGAALMTAYRLEHEAARFPRILVSREVREDAVHYEIDKHVFQSDDGPHFLHVLRRWRNRHLHDDDVKRYTQILRQVQTRFNESVDNPRHFEKVQWFARYMNMQRPSAPDIEYLCGPGVR